jgi:hypothetical protein
MQTRATATAPPTSATAPLTGATVPPTTPNNLVGVERRKATSAAAPKRCRPT